MTPAQTVCVTIQQASYRLLLAAAFTMAPGETPNIDHIYVQQFINDVPSYSYFNSCFSFIHRVRSTGAIVDKDGVSTGKKFKEIAGTHA